MKFCSNCGQKISFGKVPDDEKERFYCENCNFIHYQNPKIIVGTLPRWEDKILLCKRAIEPRKNLWTLPAGFLENGERIEDGGIRETVEEANAEIEIDRLFSVYSLPHVSQIYCMFLAHLVNLNFHPGHESLEVELFKKEEIPWDEIAFSSIRFTLDKFVNAKDSPNHEVHLGAWNNK
ncbi:NUDIX hydrolase [candidate division KSB1 bacterium]|nr:NUDIX hydrolase [candidate division KSB1 bacterium]